MKKENWELLLAHGKVIKPLAFSKDREKAYGAMYSGSATIEYKGVTMYFQLYYHHDKEVCMTWEEVVEHMSLKNFQYEGVGYDKNWYCYKTDHELWLHKEGWFNHENIALYERMQYTRNNPLTIDELIELGFIRLDMLTNILD